MYIKKCEACGYIAGLSSCHELLCQANEKCPECGETMEVSLWKPSEEGK